MTAFCESADRCQRCVKGLATAECVDCGRNSQNQGVGKHHDHLRDNFTPWPGMADPSPWQGRAFPRGYVMVANVTAWLAEIQHILGAARRMLPHNPMSRDTHSELSALALYIRGITESLEAPRSDVRDPDVLDTLCAAAQAFRDYEAVHTAKAMTEAGSAQRVEKADANRRLAERMEAAVAGLESRRG